MRALVLAAGLGTRLRPLTETLPKCLVPIHGVPLLEYWLTLLLSRGIERVLVNTGYLAEQVRVHVARSRWRDGVDLVHETDLLGTGGTVLSNRAFFGGGPFLVAHGDNLSRFDPAAFIARHRARPAGCDITMMTFDTDSPRSCGSTEVLPAFLGRICTFHNADYHRDIGTLDSLRRAEEEFRPA